MIDKETLARIFVSEMLMKAFSAGLTPEQVNDAITWSHSDLSKEKMAQIKKYDEYAECISRLTIKN